MEKFEIARIIKPQGIKGDVKIHLLVPDFDIAGKTVYIDGKLTKVERAYNVGGAVAIKLDCINSRNDAENYRNKSIEIDRNEIKIPDGKYLVADLVQKQIFLDSGEFVGKLVDVLNFGSADVFVIKSNTPKHYIMCSHKVGLISSVEPDKVILNGKTYKETAVDYEDN